jgi:hypothetical protein
MTPQDNDNLFRFIPVRSDDRTVFTCFLEWETATDEITKDGSGCTVKVHDLVHVKKGIGKSYTLIL